jgi:steroid delta-isomerase-like uncharacterized protein
MRTRWLSCCLLVSLAVVACKRDEAPPAAASAPAPAAVAAAPAVAAKPAAPAGAASTRAVLDAWNAAWNAHDTTRLGLMLAEDVEYFDSGFAGLQHGRTAALDQGIWVFLRGMPDLQWELRGEPIVGNDAVAWEWTLVGTHTGTWGGVRATRQQVRLKGVSLMRLREGKVAQVSMYYDSIALNRQLGL